jgi:hypothetical protein
MIAQRPNWTIILAVNSAVTAIWTATAAQISRNGPLNAPMTQWVIAVSASPPKTARTPMKASQARGVSSGRGRAN